MYIIEKQEISDDEDDLEYERLMKQSVDQDDDLIGDVDLDDDSDDDLEDFTKLKVKQEQKAAKQMQKTGVSSMQKSSMGAAMGGQPQAASVERPVVVDDFIRNFLTQCGMTKSMNIFQQEWFELQKKGTFQDLGIGLITDITNKNARLEVKIAKMRTELETAKVIADDAKSTWEKLRKERDYHKTHQDRVNGEKLEISQTIKEIKVSHELVEDKIEEVKKKLLDTTKEKALLKLEKDKLQKRAFNLQGTIKAQEEKVQKDIEA